MLPNYLKETLKFIQEIGQLAATRIGPIGKSAGFISPGDILIFNQVPGGRQKSYPSDNMNPIVLVVSNQRGKGMFVSTRDNLLLSCYHINHISPELAISIIKVLYKNRRSSDYYRISISGLQAYLGDNYRTYNFDYITSLNKLFIDMRAIDSAEQDLE